MTSKNTHHADRREKIGSSSTLLLGHPVSLILAAAGMGYIGGESIGVIESDFEIYYPDEDGRGVR